MLQNIKQDLAIPVAAGPEYCSQHPGYCVLSHFHPFLYLRPLMEILIRRASIIDPSSPFHRQTAAILISNGTIVRIGDFDVPADTIIEAEGLCVSPGWMDLFSHFNDPGFEHKETIATGARAAAAGGFTDVMVLPNTNPVVHNKSSVEYAVQRGRETGVNIHPIGAVTRNAEGKELAEMYDMHASGAVAFSDGIVPIQSAGLLIKALLYLKPIGATIIQVPDDQSLSSGGLMNEGVASTKLGLPGTPAIGEELMIARDIELLRYTGSRLHITGVSTAKGIDAIRKAKAEGLSLTCSVTPFHLRYIDEDLSGYDTNLKLRPALRTAADRKALQEAVLDGTVDAIAAHHFPQDTDSKVVEFEYAKHGMISLETAFSLVATAIPQLDAGRLAELFCFGPRAAFGMQTPRVAENERACLTLFQTEAAWTPRQFHSRSKNSVLTGTTLRGRPLGIISGANVFLNQ